MYRTIYEKATGKILISRRMSDELLTKRLADYPTQGALNVFTADVDKFKVNLSDLTIEAVTPVAEDLQHWLRLHRNGRLKSCDWTQGADSPLSDTKKAEWATYRQQLRDLPGSYSNLTDKSSITWPTKPT
tara:strand:+ start:1654 stop:2043 length:390 start_codon:yes stop_codon:yes gene_type:complete